MNGFNQKTGTAAQPQPNLVPNPVVDPELQQALVNFRQSVHAWSEAEFNRPRTARLPVHNVWRPVLAWALGCMFVAGAAGGGLYEHHRETVERQLAQQRIAHEKQLAAQKKAQEADENLLANVDNDVSRSVPAAMEPLAQLMEDNGTN